MISNDSGTCFGTGLASFKRKRNQPDGNGDVKLTEDQKKMLDQACRNPLFASISPEPDSLFIPQTYPMMFGYDRDYCVGGSDEDMDVDEDACEFCLSFGERCAECKLNDENFVELCRNRELKFRSWKLKSRSKAKAKSRSKSRSKSKKKVKQPTPPASEVVALPPQRMNDIEAKAQYENFLIRIRLRGNNPDSPQPGCSKWSEGAPIDKKLCDELAVDQQKIMERFNEILHGGTKKYSLSS